MMLSPFEANTTKISKANVLIFLVVTQYVVSQTKAGVEVRGRGQFAEAEVVPAETPGVGR